MDRQTRVTKYSELQLGAVYEWVNGKTVLRPYTLDEIKPLEGHIVMNGIRHYAWQGRYRLLSPTKC